MFLTLTSGDFVLAQEALLKHRIADPAKRAALAAAIEKLTQAVEAGADPTALAAKLEPPPPTPGVLPPGMAWPTETYSEARRKYGWDIVRFLEERWQPLIAARIVTRPVLRQRDPSADTAIANYLRGGKRSLPPGLQIPTKQELNDALFNSMNSEFISGSNRLSLVARRRRSQAIP